MLKMMPAHEAFKESRDWRGLNWHNWNVGGREADDAFSLKLSADRLRRKTSAIRSFEVRSVLIGNSSLV